MAAAAATRRPKGTDGIAGLPEELLLEVFSRVGNIKALFMFAVTSRRWLRRFTDPAFLRGLCPGEGHGHHHARLLGFFSQPTAFVRCDSMVKMRMARGSASPPAFLPAPGSPLGRADRALTSFVSDDDGAFSYATPLAARRGFVLMQLVPKTFDVETVTDTEPERLILGLCNPITGERHVLPPPVFECPGDGRCYVFGYAIVTAADGDLDGNQHPPPPSGGFRFSQLLLISAPRGGRESDQVVHHSYSAATRSWSAPTMCLDRRRFEMKGERLGVVHEGAAHWLWIDREARERAPRDDHNMYKLSAELGTARVSLTKLTVRVGGTPILCVSRDNKLSIACVYLMHVAVWTQQDGDRGDGDTPAAWLCTQVIRIPAAVPNPNDPPGLQLQHCQEWFEFNKGSMLVMYRSGSIFILDLDKEVMEKVMDCFPRLVRDTPHDRYICAVRDGLGGVLCVSSWWPMQNIVFTQVMH